MKKLFLGLLLGLSTVSLAQKLDKDKQYYISAMGFWNVENLYDTLNDQWKNDEEFTPSGTNVWNGHRYWIKIDRLAEVIGKMATDVTPDGLAIVGLCEIENKSVVEDLVKNKRIANRNYQIVHIEGPDRRGVDPSFIYNPSYFKVTNSRSYTVKLVTDSTRPTRDILVVSGLFMGEPLTVLVNHWPSRRGGELKSRPDRNAASIIARRIIDSVMAANPETKIASMGDYNDDPTNVCIKDGIKTYGDLKKPKEGCLFNPMEKPFKDGIGSLGYNDAWNLFDQIIINKPFTSTNFSKWQYYDVRIYNKSFLCSDYGNFKGGTFRTYSGGVYTGGYSDHFPVFIMMAKEKKAPDNVGIKKG
jgi:hypothetical protein